MLQEQNNFAGMYYRLLPGGRFSSKVYTKICPYISLLRLWSHDTSHHSQSLIIRRLSRWPWLAKNNRSWFPEAGHIALLKVRTLFLVPKKGGGWMLSAALLICVSFWVWSKGAHELVFLGCLVLPWFVCGHTDMNQKQSGKAKLIIFEYKRNNSREECLQTKGG